MSPFTPDRQHLYLHLNGLFTEKKRQHIKRGPRYTKAEGTKVIRDYIKYYSWKNTVCAYAVGWSEFYCPSAQAADLFLHFGDLGFQLSFSCYAIWRVFFSVGSLSCSVYNVVWKISVTLICSMLPYLIRPTEADGYKVVETASASFSSVVKGVTTLLMLSLFLTLDLEDSTHH